MAWLRTSLSRLRDTPAPTLGLALLTLATAFVCASLPRVLARDEDDVLRADVRAAPFSVRNLQLTQAARIGASADGGLGVVQATGDGLQEGLPGPVRTLVVARQTVVDTPRFTASNRKLDLTTVRLRFQPGAEERVRLVDGRLPTSASRAVARPGGGEPLVAVEVALPVASARVLQAAVGDTLLLAVDGTDPLSLVVRGARAIDAGGSMAIDIVGTYEVADEADTFWYGDTSLARPTIRSLSSVTQAQDATALAAPAAYRSAVGLADRVGFGIRYTWRSLIDPGRLDAAGLGDVIAGLRRMESVFPLATARVDLGKTSLASGLLGLLDAHGDRWASVQAVLAVAAVGAAAVAAAALTLVAVLAAARRRRSVAVWRGRGASRGQVLGSVAAEGLLLTLPLRSHGRAARRRPGAGRRGDHHARGRGGGQPPDDGRPGRDDGSGDRRPAARGGGLSGRRGADPARADWCWRESSSSSPSPGRRCFGSAGSAGRARQGSSAGRTPSSPRSRRSSRWRPGSSPCDSSRSGRGYWLGWPEHDAIWSRSLPCVG